MSWEILSLKDSSKWEEYLNKLPIEQQDINYHPKYFQIYKGGKFHDVVIGSLLENKYTNLKTS